MKTVISIMLFIYALSGYGQALVVGSIASSQFICTSCLPAILNSTPPNGTSPTYQWQSSLNNSTFTNIDGATMTTYQPGYLTATHYYRQQQNATGVTGGPLPTNTVTLTVTQMQLIRLLRNDTITDAQCYNAMDTLSVAVDSSHSWRITNTSNVTMVAGQVIQFFPGSHFDSASYLRAYVRSTIKAFNKLAQASIRKVNGQPVNYIKNVNGVPNY